MTTQIQHIERDTMTVTMHEQQTARYVEPWRSPDATHGSTPLPDIIATENSLSRFQARVDALREQINFALNALKLSETELDAISANLSGTNKTV